MSSTRWRRWIFRTASHRNTTQKYFNKTSSNTSQTAHMLLFVSPDETHFAVVGSKWFVTILATSFCRVSMAVYQCGDIEYDHEDEQHDDEDYGQRANETRLRRFFQRRRKLRWRYAIWKRHVQLPILWICVYMCHWQNITFMDTWCQ